MSIVVRVKQKQIAQLISKGKRLDGRDLYEYRDIKIEQGIIEKAEGSAKVLLGKTEVMVGVKIEVGQPFLDTPNDGVLTVNAELVPLASPTFEPGPPDENSIELARVVDRGIRESKAVDLPKLCIEPGKKVFVLFVDIYVLNHDGNLIDASALAALAALKNTKIFNYEVQDGEIKIKPGYTPLQLQAHPIAITFAKINDKLVVDPWLEEEQVMDARLTITTDDQGRICAVQKGGSGFFTTKQIMEAAQIAVEKAKEIRKKLGWVT
ncbi:MAG: exosome complex protein Rrp42 [Candidatus Bathyarchaeota archaeon]|nr:exosome complex protein Rrp42 [Candidatus Bathyarchaeota archaeon]MCX8177599.1 exosome complex protein Rrp42 [Candidatus Bathyarchaeota archaeon]MDW8194307.1 exosome complex protein Rrp42 [Nitrososphaerota archaeon]